MELLTFRLTGRQLFGINVFKVKEVVSLPSLTLMPKRNPMVCGVTYLRGQDIAVIDMSKAIGGVYIRQDDKCNIIICEFNRSVQAFLVGSVDRIVNLNWEELSEPPVGIGFEHFITAITQLEDDIVEILDVEKILADLTPYNSTISVEALDVELCRQATGMRVLVADDSSVARAQLGEALSQLQLDVTVVKNGERALDMLEQWVATGVNMHEEVLMVITDAEMPQMDGYRLTTRIRDNPALKDLYIVLHTSLSGSFNSAMVEQVGCDEFLAKYRPDDIAEVAQKRIRQILKLRNRH